MAKFSRKCSLTTSRLVLKWIFNVCLLIGRKSTLTLTIEAIQQSRISRLGVHCRRVIGTKNRSRTSSVDLSSLDCHLAGVMKGTAWTFTNILFDIKEWFWFAWLPTLVTTELECWCAIHSFKLIFKCYCFLDIFISARLLRSNLFQMLLRSVQQWRSSHDHCNICFLCA